MTVEQQGMHPALTGGDGRPPIAGEVVLPGQGQAVVLPEGVEADLGLEDIGIEEIPTPRIRIKHRLGMYKDSQTGVETPAFNAIILGLVRQRVMFSKVVKGDDDDVPQCKSVNFTHGMPNVDPTSRNQFPWDASPWNQNEVPIDPATNRVLLQCAACPFKEWQRHGNSSEPPACSDVWNLVVMYDPYGNGQAQPAFLAVKKTGIANVRKHIAKYKQSKTPMFVDIVQFSLEEELRGENAYQKPVIQVIGQTDPGAYAAYAENFKALRDFITTIRPAEGGDMGVQSTFEGPEWENATPAQPQQTYVQQPAPPAQPVAQPIQSPVQQPVAQAAPPVAPPAPQAPAPTSAPQVPTPVPQVTAPAPAPVPTPVAPSVPQVPSPPSPSIPGSIPAPMPQAQAQASAPEPAPEAQTGGAAPWAAGTPGDDEDLPF